MKVILILMWIQYTCGCFGMFVNFYRLIDRSQKDDQITAKENNEKKGEYDNL